MVMTRKLLVLIVWLLYALQVIGQEVQQKKRIKINKGLQVILKDTIFITRKDTTIYLDAEEAEKIRIRENPYTKSSKFYDSLEEKVSDSKVGEDIFDLVIKKKKGKEKLVNAVVKSVNVFIPYAGYTIGSITFKSVDMLEGSVIDTLREASSKFGKFVNNVHRDTRSHIIERNLFFEVGDVVDPYELADNERILREFKTLRDARIYLRPNKKQPKVVDVVVVTQDVASIGASGDYSSFNNFRLDVYDINILGYAKQLQVSYFRNADQSPENGYEITLREQNFLNTFIQGELQYTDNYLRQRTRLALGRDFFTPQIKYAGGLELYRTSEKFYAEEYDTLDIPFDENYVDLWAGRSFEFNKRMNLIFSARLNNRNFIHKPFVSSDSNTFFHDRTFALGSISVTKRNFLKSLRIRGFGKTEDIPIGGSISVLAGAENNEFVDRTYYEINGVFGKYFSSLGYVNLSLAAGSFFKRGSAQDGVVTTSAVYFSDLIKLRKTQLRQFVFFSYTRGVNRVLDRTVSLDGKWRDDRDIAPIGDRKITVGLESVYFMPWYTYGFQFALFYRIDLSSLSNSSISFLDDRLFFYSIRAGARMLNENLILPGFSIELAYFGKNKSYSGAWEFKLTTTLPNLFGTRQVFKPQVLNFE